jgi:hypothetical protein
MPEPKPTRDFRLAAFHMPIDNCGCRLSCVSGDFFFSNEGDPREPPHVHVRRGEALAKFWLRPVQLADSYGFGGRTLDMLAQLVEDNGSVIEEAWHEHFG